MVLDEEEVPLDDYSKSIYSFSKQFEKQTNIQTAVLKFLFFPQNYSE